MDTTLPALVDSLRHYRLLEPEQLTEVATLSPGRFAEPKALARELLQRGWLTPYQANQLLNGRGQELVLGSYLLLERLGEGGMGQVFKARHQNLGRIVAVKLIRKERLASADAVRRFQREIRAAAQLNHPNIVRAYDAAEVDGNHLLVMEYVDGGADLSRLVKLRGPLPVAEACDLMRQAAVGLQHAHERGMVHRDIKPHNLLLTADGKTVKILDMGLARLDDSVSDDEKSSTMTQDGAVMGTPDYIAPEQARSSHDVDIRADIYSLGCTFYYLLTGRVPFPGGSLTQKLLKHQLDEPQPVEAFRADVSPEFGAILRKMMAKRPQDRFQTPGELAETLADPSRSASTVPDLGGQSLPTLPQIPRARSAAIADSTEVDRHWAEVVQAAAAVPAQPRFTQPESAQPQLTPVVPVDRRKRYRITAGAGAALALIVLLLVWRPWKSAPTNSLPVEPTVAQKQSRPEKNITNSIGMKLVLIPAGSFLMGSPETEPGRRANEGPQHDVRISRPFYLGVYEVTQEQYEKVMDKNPSAFQQGKGGGAEHPVDTIGWDAAVAFCRKLSALEAENKAGRIYRLPTEAEWEYACRAGSQTAFYFGDDREQLPRHAWFKENDGGKTHPVGQLEPNAWGLYDMSGNVWEWCDDSYAADYYQKSPATDPSGPPPGSFRVIRGGGIGWDWTQYRSANRYPDYSPAGATSNTGFRVVCEVPRETIINSIGMRLIQIPSGKFLMGSPESEPGRRPNEGPQHEVAITKSFYMGACEVTQEQYRGVTGQNPSGHKVEQGGGPDHPVDSVTWPEAVLFCRLLSDLDAERRARRVYRLPTEAEWEYACRAGTDTAYSFGDDPALLGDYGWWFGNDAGKTHPVGRKKPNPWGLFDMHGNNWELCADYYAADYYARAPLNDPKGPEETPFRVLRGGAIQNPASESRSANRWPDWPPEARLNRVGFRVVCDVER